MHLYFSPLSCSLACRIALYEAGLDAETEFHHVTLTTKRYDADADYWAINPRGQVPALVTRDGALLTENAAVLQYIADLVPATQLAPPPTHRSRYELQQWLSFIGSELHKQVFAVVFHPHTPPEAKAYAVTHALPSRLDFVQSAVAGREFLLGDNFTIADGYLVTVLNWLSAAGVDRSRWPALRAYHAHLASRPHVRRAIDEERALSGRV